VISKPLVLKFLQIKPLQNALYGRLSGRRHSCSCSRRCAPNPGGARHAEGVILREPGWVRLGESGRRTGNFRGETEKVPSPEPSSTKFARRRPQSAKSYTKGGPGCFTGSCRFEGAGQVFRTIVSLVRIILLAAISNAKPDYSASLSMQ